MFVVITLSTKSFVILFSISLNFAAKLFINIVAFKQQKQPHVHSYVESLECFDARIFKKSR